MPINQTDKLVWIVDTIHKAGKITFSELNEKWINEKEFSGGVEMLKRTFHKWKDKIHDTFGLDIYCEEYEPYRYYIYNDEDIRLNKIQYWLLNTKSISNTLRENIALKDRIILEDIPSGREYLEPIIGAMKSNHYVHISYYSYWEDDVIDHYIMPLCLKIFRQRWYLVGRKWPSQKDLVFCLDRIRDFRLSSHTFEFPKDFDAQDYFDGFFGVIISQKIPLQDVILKVDASQANYLRDLPLMQGNSQEELECNEEFSIFRIRVRPTFDFVQELLWNMDMVEVLEPQILRDEVAGITKRMSERYNTTNQIPSNNDTGR